MRSLISLIVFLPLFYLSRSSSKYVNSINYNFKSDSSKPDYSNLNYWAAHPYKYDPSDSAPLGLKNEYRDSLADVFFIHSTTYTDSKMPMGWNADIMIKN